MCNEIRRLPNETIKELTVRTDTLVQKSYSFTHDCENTKNDRKSNDENTIKEDSNQNESHSIVNSQTRFRFLQTRRKMRTGGNHSEVRRNGKPGN